jgi:hypothetical protein
MQPQRKNTKKHKKEYTKTNQTVDFFLPHGNINLHTEIIRISGGDDPSA